MENITRTILADNLESARFGIAKLAKRARRLSLPEPVLTSGEPYAGKRLVANHAGGRYVDCFYVSVTISNAMVQLPGWNLVAVLEHEEKLVRTLGDKSLPAQYRECVSNCDHCKTSRKRLKTYVLQNDSRFTQVGSSCVQDFLGHDAVRAVLVGEYALEIDELLGDAQELGSSKRSHFNLVEVLVMALRSIAYYGWISGGKKYAGEANFSTKDSVIDLLREDPSDPELERKFPALPEYAVRAQAIMDWALSISDSQVASSEYLYNLRQIAQNDFVTMRSMGLAVSMPSAFDRAEAERLESESAAKVSNHFGTVGERGIFTLTLKRFVSMAGDFGPVTLYIMEDANGNVANWYSSGQPLESNELNLNPHPGDISSYRTAVLGDTVTLKATVKRHGEYKGAKVTMLGRASMYVAPVKKSRAKKVA